MAVKLTIRRCKQCNERFQQVRTFQYLCMPPKDCSWKYQKILKLKKEAKEWKDKKAEMKIDTHSKEHKKSLQNEINKLSKLIDFHFDNFNCIDCGMFLNRDIHQIDACHLISVKKNSSLRYNLHNLHSGHNHCNCYNENHETSYKKGIVERYGIEYLNIIETLPIKHKEIKLSNVEVSEKLVLVRKLIRTFDTYKFNTAVEGRSILNNIIGIYK